MTDFHLLVLVHGLWGNKSHFDYICQELEKIEDQFSGSEKLIIHRAHGNEGHRTLDGIDVCGLRVAQEVISQITTLNKTGAVKKISMVGYSLGGLISRHAVGILYDQGIFDHIQPVNFTTFCTPHVGVLTPGWNITVRLFNTIVPSVLSLSGKQMFLKDHHSREKTLLSSMANPSSVFFKGLQSFKHRQLYANAINDKRTAWWTSGISRVDPFIKITENTSLECLEFPFVPSYGPIVINSDAPFIISDRFISTEEADAQPSDEQVEQSGFWARKLRWVYFVVNLVFFLPLWVIWFICSNFLESLKSYRRIKDSLREHAQYLSKLAVIEEDDTKSTDGLSDTDEEIELDDYTDVESFKSLTFFDDPIQIENTLQDRADDLMESLWDAMTSKTATESARIEKYQIKPLEENSADQDFSNGDIPSIRASIKELCYFAKDSPQANNDVLKPFTLELCEEQLNIVKYLNQLQWEKYPILIRKTTSTHSAAIVRNIEETQLYEGKVVIRHWLDNVFKLE